MAINFNEKETLVNKIDKDMDLNIPVERQRHRKTEEEEIQEFLDSIRNEPPSSTPRILLWLAMNPDNEIVNKLIDDDSMNEYQLQLAVECCMFYERVMDNPLVDGKKIFTDGIFPIEGINLSELDYMVVPVISAILDAKYRALQGGLTFNKPREILALI